MAKWVRSRNAVNMHLEELSSRIVADSGIPTDRYHLGKLILQSLKDAPDYLSQVSLFDLYQHTTELRKFFNCIQVKKEGLDSIAYML